MTQKEFIQKLKDNGIDDKNIDIIKNVINYPEENVTPTADDNKLWFHEENQVTWDMVEKFNLSPEKAFKIQEYILDLLLAEDEYMMIIQ